MIVTCGQCQSRFRFDERKLTPGVARRVRCSKCGSIFEVKAPEPEPPATEAADPNRLSSQFSSAFGDNDLFEPGRSTISATAVSSVSTPSLPAASPEPSASGTTRRIRPAGISEGGIELSSVSQEEADDVFQPVAQIGASGAFPSLPKPAAEAAGASQNELERIKQELAKPAIVRRSSSLASDIPRPDQEDAERINDEYYSGDGVKRVGPTPVVTLLREVEFANDEDTGLRVEAPNSRRQTQGPLSFMVRDFSGLRAQNGTLTNRLPRLLGISIKALLFAAVGLVLLVTLVMALDHDRFNPTKLSFGSVIESLRHGVNGHVEVDAPKPSFAPKADE